MSKLLELNSHKFKILCSFFFIFTLTSCSTVSEPAYETVYEPLSDQSNQEAFDSSYVACFELALVDAQAAYEKVWSRQTDSATFVNSGWLSTGSITSGLNGGSGNSYYSSGSGSLPYNSAGRVALNAVTASENAHMETMRSCMMENGFEETRNYLASSD